MHTVNIESTSGFFVEVNQRFCMQIGYAMRAKE